MACLTQPDEDEDLRVESGMPSVLSKRVEEAEAQETAIKTIIWRMKRDNVWDNADIRALTEGLHKERPPDQAIGGRPCKHLQVWQDTCRGMEYIDQGMLLHWKDDQAPRRLRRMQPRKEYGLDPVKDKAFWKLLEEELKEGIVRPIRHDQVCFLNPTFIVPKAAGKWRKVMYCRTLDSEMEDIHFRMDESEVVKGIALTGD
jgi:hypothetical protein